MYSSLHEDPLQQFDYGDEEAQPKAEEHPPAASFPLKSRYEIFMEYWGGKLPFLKKKNPQPSSNPNPTNTQPVVPSPKTPHTPPVQTLPSRQAQVFKQQYLQKIAVLKTLVESNHSSLRMTLALYLCFYHTLDHRDVLRMHEANVVNLMEDYADLLQEKVQSPSRQQIQAAYKPYREIHKNIKRALKKKIKETYNKRHTPQPAPVQKTYTNKVSHSIMVLAQLNFLDGDMLLLVYRLGLGNKEFFEMFYDQLYRDNNSIPSDMPYSYRCEMGEFLKTQTPLPPMQFNLATALTSSEITEMEHINKCNADLPVTLETLPQSYNIARIPFRQYKLDSTLPNEQQKKHKTPYRPETNPYTPVLLKPRPKLTVIGPPSNLRVMAEDDDGLGVLY